jgi:hypothetical protein
MQVKLGALQSMDSLCLLAIHFFEQEELHMLCILPRRGTEYCEKAEQHAY